MDRLPDLPHACRLHEVCGLMVETSGRPIKSNEIKRFAKFRFWLCYETVVIHRNNIGTITSDPVIH